MALVAGGAISGLDESLRNLGSANPVARVAGVEQLAARTPQDHAAVAERVLYDPDPSLRAAAAATCRASADPLVVELARQTLHELLAGDDATRRAGLRAAIWLGNPFTIPRLFRFLEHADPETRQLALAAITVPDPGLLAASLVRVRIEPLLADPVYAVRAAARRALTRMDSART